MKAIPAADKEWTDAGTILERGEAFSEVVVVGGPSKSVAQRVQSLLQEASFKGESFQYYLSSGNEHFRVPCYLLFADGETISEPLSHFHMLQEQPSIQEQPSRAVSRLEQKIADRANRPSFVIIEYLTPPGRHDFLFTVQLLRSPCVRSIPLLVFIHGSQLSGDPFASESAVDEALTLLYICGGRVRIEDWVQITEISAAHCPALAIRRIGSETWVCYAYREAAERASDCYRALDQEKRSEMARFILQTLPNNTGYPLLAIATETEDIAAMQSKYSFAVLNAALAEPESVVRYFDRLYCLARQAAIASLEDVALICSLVAPMYVAGIEVLQIYQKVQKVDLAHMKQELAMAFWLFLGQRLAVANVPEAWGLATECLNRSRALIDHLCQAGKMQEVKGRFIMANAAKVEALAAYKEGEGERTCRLMEFSIEEFRQLRQFPYLISARTNLGDALQRLLGDTPAAITQYEEAIGTFLRVPEERKGRLGLSDWSGLRPMQKLGDALTEAGRYEEAIQIFEMLLSRLGNLTTTNGKDVASLRFKARLALAEVYLKAQRPRSAAACYWLILRQAGWLDLKEETAAKLRLLRPNLSQCLHQRIDTIIRIQRGVSIDVATIQHMLASL